MKELLREIGVFLGIILAVLLLFALVVAVPVGLVYALLWVFDQFTFSVRPATWQDVAVVAVIVLGFCIPWSLVFARRR